MQRSLRLALVNGILFFDATNLVVHETKYIKPNLQYGTLVDANEETTSSKWSYGHGITFSADSSGPLSDGLKTNY